MSIKKIIVCLTIPFLFNACQRQVAPKPQSKKISHFRKQKSFSRLSAIGHVDIKLNAVKKGSSVTLIGDSRDVPEVETKVVNGQLLLNANLRHSLHAPLTAIVNTPVLNEVRFVGFGDIKAKNFKAQSFDLFLKNKGNVNLAGKIGLRKLNVKGSANVTIKGVSSRALEIDMKDSPNVKLEGVANLEILKYSGEGKLGLYWVKSRDLQVMGYGKAKVDLAGVVRFLHVVLHDNSELDGRYLRVQKAYVKAFDTSLIRLQPIKQLNAYAAQNGHIYYYSEPHFKAAYMSEHGAVLDYQPVAPAES